MCRTAARRRGPAEILVTPDGAVTSTVHREATTLLVHRIGPLRHLVDITARATAHAS